MSNNISPSERTASTPSVDVVSTVESTPTAETSPVIELKLNLPEEEAEVKVKKRVLVVDDELVGLQPFHLPDEIQAALADLTSPEVAEAWEQATNILGFPELDKASPKVIRDFVNSERIVSELFLNPTFQENVKDPLRTALQFFYTRAAAVADLRKYIVEAFPSSEFNLEFSPTRPSALADLLQYDLLILDLVLQKSGSAVDEIVGYLSKLGKDAYPQRIPCIIVMSSHPELIQNQILFSTASNISAAGLLILPKGELAKAEFGSTGLELSYRQLDRQRDVAQQMRVFMRAWTDALEDAKSKAATAMWNLDAAAMQEIHLVAHNDNDPYDEHLNALISREYLWHVESAKSVVDAIDQLDICFQSQFKEGSEPAVIKQRFIAPFVKPQPGRDLVSHFTWVGMPLPEKLANVDVPAAKQKFSKLVPFGALLAPPGIASGVECLVHITQQCDLNQKRDGQSVQFAVVTAKLVKDYAIDDYDKDDLVARGLPIDGKEYDFVLEKGKQISLPRDQFITWARRRKLQVFGRLRNDIASHFLLATANHMTRWASQKVDQVKTHNVTLYLHGANIPTGYTVCKDAVTGNPLTVQIAHTNSKKIYFQDNTSIKIALWIVQELSPYYDVSGLSAELICNRLSIGLSNNDCLSKFTHLKLHGIRPKDLKGELSMANANKLAKKVNLVCVYDPDILK